MSICIPTYNGARYLEACLDSVLSQTFQDVEILLVDDGSSDATVDISTRYAAADKRIKLSHNDRNLGLVGNWNRCIELAQGDWIKFVFQDDLIAPTCVEDMLFASSPNTPLTVCRRNFVFEEGTSEETSSYYENHPNPERIFSIKNDYICPRQVCDAAIKNFGVNMFGEPTATLIHRQAFAEYGLFNPGLAMICDTEFWVRVAVHCGFTYIPKTLASFRVHYASTSAYMFSERKFRIQVDGALLMHEYMHNPVFKPLRKAARGLTPKRYMHYQFEKQLSAIRCSIIESENIDDDSNLRHELDDLIIRYPELSKIFGGGKSISQRLTTIFGWL